MITARFAHPHMGRDVGVVLKSGLVSRAHLAYVSALTRVFTPFLGEVATVANRTSA